MLCRDEGRKKITGQEIREAERKEANRGSKDKLNCT
jgi:hypothetical protein